VSLADGTASSFSSPPASSSDGYLRVTDRIKGVRGERPLALIVRDPKTAPPVREEDIKAHILSYRT
jgi:hypothetical protein